jgi:anion-transporting  ArsA/GET3 family ATPase
MNLLDRRLLFVTGKGGVGKSTVAAALSLLAAQHAKKALACEVDAKGDLAALFETAPLDFEPRQIFPGLSGMAMHTEASLDEYLRLQLRVPGVSKIGPLAKAFEFVATAAPGVREILTVGQLTAPQAINSLVRVGAIRNQTGWVLDILADPAQTALVVVTTPEEMPVRETVDLVRRVRAETPVHVAAVVVNRVLPELFSHSDEEVFERLREPAVARKLARAAKGRVGQLQPVFDGARLAVTLRRSRTGHLDMLRRELGPDLPLLYVPELFTRGYGLRTTGQVADALAAELGY